LWEIWELAVISGVLSSMKKVLISISLAAAVSTLQAQRQGPGDIGASPMAIGEQGVVWYATWESALAEAKRSNRPIFFMSAAAQCRGISGVF